jgi:hypothetical protein
MIKFVRKIRLKLLIGNKPACDQGRLSKYPLCAIGEILLVVIGIMIALYVNHKNQERGEEEEIKAPLVEI